MLSSKGSIVFSSSSPPTRNIWTLRHETTIYLLLVRHGVFIDRAGGSVSSVVRRECCVRLRRLNVVHIVDRRNHIMRG